MSADRKHFQVGLNQVQLDIANGTSVETPIDTNSGKTTNRRGGWRVRNKYSRREVRNRAVQRRLSKAVESMLLDRAVSGSEAKNVDNSPVIVSATVVPPTKERRKSNGYLQSNSESNAEANGRASDDRVDPSQESKAQKDVSKPPSALGAIGRVVRKHPGRAFAVVGLTTLAVFESACSVQEPQNTLQIQGTAEGPGGTPSPTQEEFIRQETREPTVAVTAAADIQTPTVQVTESAPQTQNTEVPEYAKYLNNYQIQIIDYIRGSDNISNETKAGWVDFLTDLNDIQVSEGVKENMGDLMTAYFGNEGTGDDVGLPERLEPVKMTYDERYPISSLNNGTWAFRIDGQASPDEHTGNWVAFEYDPSILEKEKADIDTRTPEGLSEFRQGGYITYSGSRIERQGIRDVDENGESREYISLVEYDQENNQLRHTDSTTKKWKEIQNGGPLYIEVDVRTGESDGRLRVNGTILPELPEGVTPDQVVPEFNEETGELKEVRIFNLTEDGERGEVTHELEPDSGGGEGVWEEVGFNITSEMLGLPDTVEDAIPLESDEDLQKLIEAEREYFNYQEQRPDESISGVYRERSSGLDWFNITDGPDGYSGSPVPVSLSNLEVDGRGNLYIVGVAVNTGTETRFAHFIIGGNIDGRVIPTYLSKDFDKPWGGNVQEALDLMSQQGRLSFWTDPSLTQYFVDIGIYLQDLDYFIEHNNNNPEIEDYLLRAHEDIGQFPEELEKELLPLIRIDLATY